MWCLHWSRAHLRLEVIGPEDGSGRDVGDELRGAVDAHSPVLSVVPALVEHRYQLPRAAPTLYVPRHRVAAAEQVMLEDVQTCNNDQHILSCVV